MRGCFRNGKARLSKELAFPAYAGMFLRIDSIFKDLFSFPRVCGDVSSVGAPRVSHEQLSPRMRGCFRTLLVIREVEHAFPAYAGMFPEIGGSQLLSPRMRGCFYESTERLISYKAFPAYAGMFPKRFMRKVLLTSFPRVCGDVSKLFSTRRSMLKLSPRMRGCFIESCKT